MSVSPYAARSIYAGFILFIGMDGQEVEGEGSGKKKKKKKKRGPNYSGNDLRREPGFNSNILSYSYLYIYLPAVLMLYRNIAYWCLFFYFFLFFFFFFFFFISFLFSSAISLQLHSTLLLLFLTCIHIQA